MFLAGSGDYSLDNRFGLNDECREFTAWMPWIFSGPLPAETARKLALWLGIACAAFTVLSYHILFGAVVSPLHSRTNFHRHNIAMSAPSVAADGSVTFEAYVDAGPDTGAAYVVAATLLDGSGQKLAQWDGAALAALTPDSSSQRLPLCLGFALQAGDASASAARRVRAPPSPCRPRRRRRPRARRASSCSKPSTAAYGAP